MSLGFEESVKPYCCAEMHTQKQKKKNTHEKKRCEMFSVDGGKHEKEQTVSFHQSLSQVAVHNGQHAVNQKETKGLGASGGGSPFQNPRI